MAKKTEDTLRVQIDDTVIENKNSAVTYRQTFNFLYERGLITNHISDFDNIVKNSKAAWGKNAAGEHAHGYTLIENSTNLFISTINNNKAKKKQLEKIFDKYKINGKVEIVNFINEPTSAVDAIHVPELTDEITEPTHIKNKLAQAICIIGDSGVGKSTRIKKTLKVENHKSLFVILDNMWQHILFDYSPKSREYVPTKIGGFIKAAYDDKIHNYTIVFDECHKNLEIINDTLLQAISLERNNGVHFLSLNSLIDAQFDYLPQEDGNRLLPDNLGFIFISSKSNIIEGNDDLRNRIKIVELTTADRDDETYLIDYLLSKIKTEEDSEYTAN